MTLTIEPSVMQMAAGDTGKRIEITIADDDALADFSTVVKADVRIQGLVGTTLVVDREPDTFVPSVDKHSAVVGFKFVLGETEDVARMWVSVVVDWGADDPQTFPDDMPLRLDFTRAAGTL